MHTDAKLRANVRARNLRDELDQELGYMLAVLSNGGGRQVPAHEAADYVEAQAVRFQAVKDEVNKRTWPHQLDVISSLLRDGQKHAAYLHLTDLCTADEIREEPTFQAGWDEFWAQERGR